MSVENFQTQVPYCQYIVISKQANPICKKRQGSTRFKIPHEKNITHCCRVI